MRTRLPGSTVPRTVTIASAWKQSASASKQYRHVRKLFQSLVLVNRLVGRLFLETSIYRDRRAIVDTQTRRPQAPGPRAARTNVPSRSQGRGVEALADDHRTGKAVNLTAYRRFGVDTEMLLYRDSDSRVIEVRAGELDRHHRALPHVACSISGPPAARLQSPGGDTGH